MKVSCLPFGLMMKTARERGAAGLIEWLDFCADHGLDGVEVGEDWLSPPGSNINPSLTSPPPPCQAGFLRESDIFSTSRSTPDRPSRPARAREIS